MSLNETLLLVHQNVNRYFCPICLTLGIVGCCFNILLFSQKQFRTISCCTYFLAASVSMMIGLIIGLVPYISAEDHPSLTDRISILCKIRGYTAQSLAMMYRWFMTMACIDRYMVSSDNVYLRQFANPRIAYSILMKIVLICIILPGHNLIFLDVLTNVCMNSTALFALYHSLFTFTFGGFLPILIMIISVILIRSNLASKQARRQYSIPHQNENRLLNPRDQQVLVMLFIQVIIYILSTIPWMIFLLYSPFLYHTKNKSINRILIEIFIKYLTEIITYMYPTLSFYIYTLTSKTFRVALINIIWNLFIGKDRSRHHHHLRTLIIKTQVEVNNKLDQSNKIYHLQSTEMKTFLEESTKIISS